MIFGRKAAWWLFLLAVAVGGRASADDSFLAVLRERAAELPVIATSAEAGSPQFITVRLNAPPILAGGERYGAVRVAIAAGGGRSLAWLFADTTNIDEYGLLSPSGARLELACTRFIHPATASADVEQERAGQHASSLPRPWDIFQLHLLGLPARRPEPAGELIIWFRFSDRRPTDVLLAATFLDPAAKLEPFDLPAIFALPVIGEP